MKNKLLIIAIVAVIGFSFITCGGNDSDDEVEVDGNGNGSENGNGNNSSEQWRTSKIKHYAVTDGVATLYSESVYNWITYRYTSDTNYDYKATENTTTYVPTTTTSSNTYNSTRNGQTRTYNNTYTSETLTQTNTQTYTYDSASGLESKWTQTQTANSGGTTSTSSSEISYNIQLLSDSGGIKTYKRSYSSYIYNGSALDISTLGYSEFKVQNGRTIEGKRYTKDAVLELTMTYTLSDNAVIKAKLGNWTLISYNYPATPANNSYETVEVVSNSATELVIRVKTFTNNVLSNQYDYTYNKVN